jgi:predicted amidohydrolase YtcJ
MGVWIANWFTEHLQLVTANDYESLSDLHVVFLSISVTYYASHESHKMYVYTNPEMWEKYSLQQEFLKYSH